MFKGRKSHVRKNIGRDGSVLNTISSFMVTPSHKTRFYGVLYVLDIGCIAKEDIL